MTEDKKILCARGAKKTNPAMLPAGMYLYLKYQITSGDDIINLTRTN